MLGAGTAIHRCGCVGTPSTGKPSQLWCLLASGHSGGMSDVLVRTAHLLGGAFCTRDATAAGLDSNALTRLVRSGEVRRVGARAYVLASAWDSAKHPEARHALRALAVLRSFDGRLLASHHTAAALYGLPFWQVDAELVHACRPTGSASRRRSNLSIHGAHPPPGHVTQFRRSGALSVSPALAVVGTALAD